MNVVKLLLVDLVNENVDDMIRIIRLMNEKNKQLMIQIIESLDSDPPLPINNSKIAIAKFSLNRQSEQ